MNYNIEKCNTFVSHSRTLTKSLYNENAIGSKYSIKCSELKSKSSIAQRKVDVAANRTAISCSGFKSPIRILYSSGLYSGFSLTVSHCPINQATRLFNTRE